MIVYDADGKEYLIEETDLKGGESKLYTVEKHPELRAKIFKEEYRTRGREAKILEWENMIERNELNKSFCDQVVVPKKCLYLQKNNQKSSGFAGCLMDEQANFKNIKEIYTAKDLSYPKKVWIARNLCVLTNRIHELKREVIIGDYSNIIVFPANGTVKLIDVDTCQLVTIYRNKRVLCPCTVGVRELIAPEIAGRLKKEKTDLENVDQDADNPIFNKYTDFYAMAYHIFALLMKGSSPFASMANMEAISQHPSKNVSSIDIDQFHAAEKGEFVFVRHFLFKKAPEYAPKYKMLSQELRKLFERAFIGGAKDPTVRPDAMEFYNALTEYFQSLKKCECGHYMPSNYKGECEWCRINRAEG